MSYQHSKSKFQQEENDNKNSLNNIDDNTTKITNNNTYINSVLNYNIYHNNCYNNCKRNIIEEYDLLKKFINEDRSKSNKPSLQKGKSYNENNEMLNSFQYNDNKLNYKNKSHLEPNEIKSKKYQSENSLDNNSYCRMNPVEQKQNHNSLIFSFKKPENNEKSKPELINNENKNFCEAKETKISNSSINNQKNDDKYNLNQKGVKKYSDNKRENVLDDDINKISIGNNYKGNNEIYTQKKKEDNINGKNKIKIKNNVKNTSQRYIKKTIPKTGIKIFHSPPKKKINNNNHNFNNNDSNDKINSVSSFRINTKKVSKIKNKGHNLDNNIVKEYNYIKKNLFKLNQNQKEKKKEKVFERLYKTPERKLPKFYPKYSFTPKINNKSREIGNKRRGKKNDFISKTPIINEKKNQNNDTNISPIFQYLYEDGKEKLKKEEERYKTEIKEIKKIANQTKMKQKSYGYFRTKMEKTIDNIINKYSENNELSIINMIQCLSELKIINKLIKNEEYSTLDIEKMKNKIKNLKKIDTKKYLELSSIEQLWFQLNPLNKKESIDKDILSNFLKFLFSSKNPKELSSNLEYIFQKDKNDENEEEGENFVSPLRDKEYHINELWSIQKLSKIFFELKNETKNYKSRNYFDKKEENIDDSKEKDEEKERRELTFRPDLSKSFYIFDKSSKYKYYNNPNPYDDYSCDERNTYNKKQQSNFDRTYKRFMDEKKMHEIALDTIRKINENREKKKCTKVPKINKDYENKMKASFDNEQEKVPVYERLYNQNKYKNTKNDDNYISLEIKIPDGATRLIKIYKNQKNINKFIDEFCKKNKINQEEKKILSKKILDFVETYLKNPKNQ